MSSHLTMAGHCKHTLCVIPEKKWIVFQNKHIFIIAVQSSLWFMGFVPISEVQNLFEGTVKEAKKL